MKKFIKENWFRVIIAVVVVLAGFSVFYYFTVFLPQQEKEKLQVNKNEEMRNWQIKCENYGKEKYGDTTEKLGDIVVNRWYGFSKTINTCIAVIESHDYKSKSEEKSLVDMYKEDIIYNYNSECSSIYANAGSTVEEIERQCPLLNDFYNKRKEVLGE